MFPFTISYPTSAETQRLKRVVKKIFCSILIGILIVVKLSNIQAVKNLVQSLPKASVFTIYLSAGYIACMLPMYFLTATVRGYNIFKFFACASLIVEGAQFFLFLGVFTRGPWVMVELGNICALLLLLTLIEELYEEKERRLVDEEIALTTTNASQSSFEFGYQNSDERRAELERDLRNIEIWRETTRNLWRSRTL